MTSIRDVESFLNKTIGSSYQKRYIGSLFWSNISTPINLAITLMTALNTGQVTTNNLISNDSMVKLNVATLILASINTFFRPNDQMNACKEYSRKWIEFGSKYEEIFFMPEETAEEIKLKYDKYKELNKEMNQFENSQSLHTNCIIDIIYLFVNYMLFQNKTTWFKVASLTDNTSSNPLGSNGGKLPLLDISGNHTDLELGNLRSLDTLSSPVSGGPVMASSTPFQTEIWQSERIIPQRMMMRTADDSSICPEHEIIIEHQEQSDTENH